MNDGPAFVAKLAYACGGHGHAHVLPRGGRAQHPMVGRTHLNTVPAVATSKGEFLEFIERGCRSENSFIRIKVALYSGLCESFLGCLLRDP